MANPNESQQQADQQQQQQQQQQQPSQSASDALMADLYYGTPMGLENNSGEFNVTSETPEEVKNRIQ